MARSDAYSARRESAVLGGIGLDRLAAAIPPVGVAAAAAGTSAGAIAHHAGVPSIAAIAIGVAIAAAAIVIGVPRLARHVPTEDSGRARRRPVRTVAWVLLAVVAIANTARLGVFMGDSQQVWASMFPPIAESAEHECLSAYVRAGELAASGTANVYDPAHYEGATSTIEGLTPRLSDPYEYPPPFLVLPRAAIAATDSYPIVRAAWFGLQVVALVVGFVLLALWVGGRAGRRALWLFPALALSFPTIANWQFGQFQLAVIVCAIGGALGIARGRYPLGGALLGFAAATKLFPGLLVVYFAARRDLRAIAWIAAGALVWLAVGWLAVGAGPIEDFLGYHLPRLASGEAFAQTEGNPDNFSLYGLFYKLDALGVPSMTRDVGAALGWAWTAVAVALAVVAGRRAVTADRGQQAILWLAVLALAGLRSPFAPTYTAVVQLWLLVMLAGRGASSALRTAIVVTGFIVFQGFPPVLDEAGNVLLSFPGQLLALTIPIVAILRVHGNRAHYRSASE